MHYREGPRPRLFAHRGGAREAPENTLEAFAHGLEAGADRLEMDVHATADGEVVVIHDATVDRTTDGRGRVADLPLEALRRLDAGFRFRDPSGAPSFRGRGVRIPTLAEVLETFPGVPLNIEIKQREPPIERAVLDLLDRSGALGSVLLAAEDGAIMERIRACRRPDVLTGFSTDDVVAFVRAWQAGALDRWEPPGAALQVPPDFLGRPLVTAELVERAHALGLEVHVWTVDDEGEIARLVALGVDGIMTDLPTVAARALGRSGRAASR